MPQLARGFRNSTPPQLPALSHPTHPVSLLRYIETCCSLMITDVNNSEVKFRSSVMKAQRVWSALREEMECFQHEVAAVNRELDAKIARFESAQAENEKRAFRRNLLLACGCLCLALVSIATSLTFL